MIYNAIDIVYEVDLLIGQRGFSSCAESNNPHGMTYHTTDAHNLWSLRWSYASVGRYGSRRSTGRWNTLASSTSWVGLTRIRSTRNQSIWSYFSFLIKLIHEFYWTALWPISSHVWIRHIAYAHTPAYMRFYKPFYCSHQTTSSSQENSSSVILDTVSLMSSTNIYSSSFY